MKRLYFQPRLELRKYIRTIQILDLPDISALNIGNRFLPDGFFEIGFNLGSDDLKISSIAASEIQLQNPVGYFYGQCSVSSQLFSGGRVHIMIVKIYPWAASLFFNFDLSDCIDDNLDLDRVFGKEAKWLEEKIMEAENYTNKVDLVQEYLITKLQQQSKSINPILEQVSKLLFQSNGNAKIKDMAAQAYSTPRTVQRIFRQYYGITPKQFAKQIRIRHFASQMSRHNDLNLAQLANACGYFDQAHFNHEFQSIVQLRPSEYFFKNTPLVDCFLQAD
ncbi:MAG: helix-turn-helix transcriptional regulator [Chitinophagales bacterium]|nr:helix-turn-helix transcriptional regulator [Chitinophagales bacterium]